MESGRFEWFKWRLSRDYSMGFPFSGLPPDGRPCRDREVADKSGHHLEWSRVWCVGIQHACNTLFSQTHRAGTLNCRYCRCLACVLFGLCRLSLSRDESVSHTQEFVLSTRIHTDTQLYTETLFPRDIYLSISI